jgi:hypothetical protein
MTFTFSFQPFVFAPSVLPGFSSAAEVDPSLPAIVQAWDDDDDEDEDIAEPADDDADLGEGVTAPLVEEEEGDPFQGFDENDFDDDFDNDFEEELEDDYEIEPDDSEMFPAADDDVELDDDIDILE